MTHEQQGTGYDSGATGHELQGRQSSPTPTAGEARVREIEAAINKVWYLEYNHLIGTPLHRETIKAIASLPASPPAKEDYDSEKLLAASERSLKHQFPASPPGEGVVEALGRIVKHLSRNEGQDTNCQLLVAQPALDIARAALRLTQGGDAGDLAVYSAEQLQTLLNERDQFIVDKGLWAEFVDQLPDNPSRLSADLHRPNPTPGSELSGAEQGRAIAGGYSGIDTSTGGDKNVAGVWIGKSLIASFDGDGSFGKALAFADGWNAKSAVSPSPNPNAGEVERDARRYRRLQVLGCAVMDTKQLQTGTVVRFTGLDAIVDRDLAIYPSRGEADRLQPLSGKERT